MTGASADGECLTQASTSLTVTTDNGTDGVCVNGGADEGTDCSADSDCDNNDCLAFIGLDGVGCTMDDITSRADTGWSFQTSGLLLAIVEGALYVEGGCANAPIPCYEDDNCTGGTGPCNNPSPSIDRIENPSPISGTGIDCTQRETSNLAGNVSAAAFSFIDAVGLGDGTSSTFLICE